MKKITAVLAVRAGEWFGAGAKLDAASAKLRRYPNSFMLRYRVVVDASRYVVLVKIPRKPENQTISDALKNESLRAYTRDYHAFMLVTWQTFEMVQDRSCFAIHPLDYFEEWNAIAMLEARGRLLKELTFLGAPPKTQHFLDHLKNAARWLKIFHERVGDLQLEIFPRAAIEAQLDGLLANLARHSRREVDIASIRTWLLSTVSDGWYAPVARTHDDFHYSNILIADDGRACGLDVRRRLRRNPIYADLATLLVDPETRVGSILTAGLFLSRQFLSQCRQSILAGYFADQPYDEAVLCFYCAMSVLDKWMINERRLSSMKYGSFLLRRWVRWYFSRLLRRHLASSRLQFTFQDVKA